MEKTKVRDLMRPVQDFARLSSGATLIEAVAALEKSQEDYLAGKAPQRILLVENDKGEIVGKLSPMDVVQGLEPNYSKIDNLKEMSRFGFSAETLNTMKDEYRLWEKPLAELCRKAYGVKIDSFVRLPAPDHMVAADERMDKAFHRFVVGRHDSLFVQEDKRIIGLIRFSDVYQRIAETMRACPLAE